MARKIIYISLVITISFFFLMIYTIKKSTEVEPRFSDFYYWPFVDDIAGVYMVENESVEKILLKERVSLSKKHKLIIREDRTYEFIDIDTFFDLYNSSIQNLNCKGKWMFTTYFMLTYDLYFYNEKCSDENSVVHHSFHIKRSEGKVYLIYFYKDFKADDYIVYERVQ